ELREAVHDTRSRERFREKDEVREIGLQARDRPFPERERLRVRIVDAKRANALLDPEAEDALQLLPERLPLIRLEIEGIDVLVLLRRVLRVLHGPVGSRAEPFR